MIKTLVKNSLFTVVSQIIVSIPILILYEVSILISKIVTKNQNKSLKNV